MMAAAPEPATTGDATAAAAAAAARRRVISGDSGGGSESRARLPPSLTVLVTPGTKPGPGSRVVTDGHWHCDVAEPPAGSESASDSPGP